MSLNGVSGNQKKLGREKKTLTWAWDGTGLDFKYLTFKREREIRNRPRYGGSHALMNY
jgi:hypothetical protein